MKEKCNEKTEVYSRVCGYFRPVANWNHGKREEFNDRKTFTMMKGKHTAAVVCAIFALILISGCSHNTISYGDGFMLETTINPESYAFGVSFRYGKILTASIRENAELEMQGAGSGNAGSGESGNTSGASSTGAVKFKVGKQVTGYYVEALKAGAKPEDIQGYTSDEKKQESALKQ